MAAAAVLALAVPSGAAAKRDPSRGCRHAAGNKAERIRTTKTGLVFTRGDINKHTFYAYSCFYSSVKVTKLPGQDGGKTKRLYDFQLGTRYVTWAVLDIGIDPAVSSVAVLDVKAGKRVSRSTAFPGAGSGRTEIASLRVTADGRAAWIASLEPTNYGVFVLPKGATSATSVATGADIDSTSLQVSKDEHQISWTQAGETKSAGF